MSQADSEYNKLLQELVDNSSNVSAERTGTGATNLFGRQLRFNLAEEFPLLTTKKVHMHSIIVELLWFLKGDTNIKYLLEHGVHIWTDWRLKEFNESRSWTGRDPIESKRFEENILSSAAFTKAWGGIGKGYGHQWRNFGAIKPSTVHSVECPDGFEIGGVKGFDQISWLINEIKTNPTSRRLIVSGWNPHEVDQVDLPPCHTLFQFFVEPMTLNERKRWVDKNYVGGGMQAITDHAKTYPNMYPIAPSDEDYREHHINVCDFANAPTSKLSCQLYQRSADYFLGVPFNIASYALLTHLIAQECGLGVGEFIWTGGVVHLYANHIEQAKLQLSRDTSFSAPNLTLNTQGKSIFDLEPSDIEVTDYQHHPAIKAPVAV